MSELAALELEHRLAQSEKLRVELEAKLEKARRYFKEIIGCFEGCRRLGGIKDCDTCKALKEIWGEG